MFPRTIPVVHTYIEINRLAIRKFPDLVLCNPRLLITKATDSIGLTISGYAFDRFNRLTGKQHNILRKIKPITLRIIVIMVTKDHIDRDLC